MSDTQSGESAERTVILRSDAAIERRVTEFGCDQECRHGLEENGDASKVTRLALRRTKIE
jgi:hypothetical protein